MKPRITMSLTADGTFELFLNPKGRDLLIHELQALNEENEHFHLMPPEIGQVEIEVSTRAYRTTDTVIEYGKVLFRIDEWDQEYYPHVMNKNE